MWWVRGILESWKICPQWLHSHGHCFPSGGGGDVRIRRRGKGKIGEGHKKILVVCKESFKEKVFLWKNILLEKYIFLGKLSLWIVFLGKSILAEKKLVEKKISMGKTRLIAVSVFPEKTQPVLWEKTLPDCVKPSIFVFSSFVIFFKYFILWIFPHCEENAEETQD